MTKYDDRDNDRNDGGDENDNTAAESRYNDPIFDLILMPWSWREVSGNDANGAADTTQYVSTRRTIYLPYKDHSKDAP